MLQALRRQTNYSGGIAAGGGDTGWDHQTQRVTLTKRITSAHPTANVELPSGTIILKTIIMPEPGLQPTAGTVDMVDRNNPVSFLTGGRSATVFDEATLATIGELVEDLGITITGTGLSAGSAVRVGFELFLPNIRP